jgi:hypothetical protein
LKDEGKLGAKAFINHLPNVFFFFPRHSSWKGEMSFRVDNFYKPPIDTMISFLSWKGWSQEGWDGLWQFHLPIEWAKFQFGRVSWGEEGRLRVFLSNIKHLHNEIILKLEGKNQGGRFLTIAYPQIHIPPSPFSRCGVG